MILSWNKVCCLYFIFLQITVTFPRKRGTRISIALAQNGIQNQCEPRETFVRVSDLLGINDWQPMYVPLKQCSGGQCNSGKACLPIEFNNITITLGYTDNGTDDMQCKNYTLTEHKSCGCACVIQQRHCTEYQKHNEEHCECECMEPYPKCTRKMNWNPSTCSCECTNKTKCSHGSMWISSMCKCMKPEMTKPGKMMLKPMN